MTENLPAKAEEFEKSPLSELFLKDPVELTDDEFRKMIEAFRKQRHLWVQEEAQARAQGTRTNHKAATGGVKQPKVQMTLDQLGEL